jgi:hypothetical protein
MINAIFFIFGLVLGASAYILLSKVFTRVDGRFIVDDNDPETTRWTLEMNGDPNDIPKKKRVIFSVIKEEN